MELIGKLKSSKGIEVKWQSVPLVEMKKGIEMISMSPPSELSFYLINLSLGCHGDDLPENEEAAVRGLSRGGKAHLFPRLSAPAYLLLGSELAFFSA